MKALFVIASVFWLPAISKEIFGGPKPIQGRVYDILGVKDEELQLLLFADQFLYRYEFQGYRTIATQKKLGFCAAGETLDMANPTAIASANFDLACVFLAGLAGEVRVQPLHVTQQIVRCPWPSSVLEGTPVTIEFR